MVFYQTPLRPTPHQQCWQQWQVFFPAKKFSPYFSFRNMTTHEWNKFYSWIQLFDNGLLLPEILALWATFKAVLRAVDMLEFSRSFMVFDHQRPPPQYGKKLHSHLICLCTLPYWGWWPQILVDQNLLGPRARSSTRLRKLTKYHHCYCRSKLSCHSLTTSVQKEWSSSAYGFIWKRDFSPFRRERLLNSETLFQELSRLGLIYPWNERLSPGFLFKRCFQNVLQQFLVIQEFGLRPILAGLRFEGEEHRWHISDKECHAAAAAAGRAVCTLWFQQITNLPVF